jgi:hypothetical protein
MSLAKPFVRVSLALGALAFSWVICSPLVEAQTGPITLKALEARLDSDPGVQANASTLEARMQAIRVAQDQAGLQYVVSASFGPAAIIVPRSVDDHVLRYGQNFGVSLPLLGTRIHQQLAILDAATQAQIARIDLYRVRREKVASLRKAYIGYWGYAQEAKIADSYISDSQWDMTTGTGLRRTGFFTETDLMDIAASVQRAKFEVDSLHSLQRSQLAAVETAIGSELPVFDPSVPDFFDGCVPNREVAIRSAYDVDPDLASYQAQSVQIEDELAHVKGSSIDTAAQGYGGSDTDLNHRVSGYHVNLAVALSLPMHARDEERALRAEYGAELNALAFNEKQRRVEIAAAVDAALDNLHSAQAILAQASSVEHARNQDLETVLVAFRYVRQNPEREFLDVHGKRDDLLSARISSSIAEQNVLTDAVDLLAVAPGACGASYETIPPMVLPTKAPRGKHVEAPASPAPRPAVALPARPVPSPSPRPVVLPSPQATALPKKP